MRLFSFFCAILWGATAHANQPVQLPELAMGNANAPVVLDEYSSITCTHCAHFYKTVSPSLKKKYIDTGKLRWIIHDFPIDGIALKLAAVVHCRGSDMLQSLRSCLMDNQDQWITKDDPLAAASSLLLMKGISKQDFKHATENQTVINALVAQRYAMENKIEGTPTFFINGKKYEGAYNAEAFSKAIDAALGTHASQ